MYDFSKNKATACVFIPAALHARPAYSCAATGTARLSANTFLRWRQQQSLFSFVYPHCLIGITVFLVVVTRFFNATNFHPGLIDH